jgi:hypothetical protein
MFCSVSISLALWIYYGVTSDLLTSIAHLAAVLLGLLIAEIFLRVSNTISSEHFHLIPQS